MEDLTSKVGYIYKIETPCGKIYIGQTINLKRRREHYRSTGYKSQLKLAKYCNKHNWKPINGFSIIEECLCGLDKENLNNREIYWIAFYDSFKNGLNCSLGGKGSLSRKHSQETKDKLRLINLGKKYSNEVNIKKGTPRTDVQKLLVSKLHKGKTISEAHKKIISHTHKGNTYAKGFKLTKEQREKISLSKLGKPLSEAHKKLLSQRRKEYLKLNKNE